MHDGKGEAGALGVVGVGASAGGLEAIREMLAPADPSSALAYVIVQHLDPDHESLLAELLSRHTALEVHQVAGGEQVSPGHVYIIPPGHGLSISGGQLVLTEFAKPRGLRRPIDDFFESLAVDRGADATCVILSGTGGDGSSGLRAIKEHGGLCIAQDPDTARYDGMPSAAKATGLVDFVREPDQIVDTIVQFHTHKSAVEADAGLARTVEDSIDDICAVVRKTVGHDFSGYKRSTLSRRIERRIQVLNLNSAGEYLRLIRSEPEECDKLFRELLINVTRFFRDGALFDALRARAIEPLVRDAGEGDIRVWVPGCSSGEEAYTIAMLFAEEVRKQRKSIMIQIFATDIDEQMLNIARQGAYPRSALADIPEAMQDRYTIARDGQFQFTARIRDMVRFSLHSVVRDPPFSNLDLVSCRNLLIYFGDTLQAGAIPVFHYALRRDGMLFLGPSETVGRFENLFEIADQKARLYRRIGRRTDYPAHLRSQSQRGTAVRAPNSAPDLPTRVEWNRSDVSDHVLRHYAPPTLQVLPSGEIQAFTGRLGRYLDLAPTGNEGQSVQALARPGLREALSAVLRETFETRKRSVVRDLAVQSEYGRQKFDLIADPLADGSVLMVFRDRDRFEPIEDDDLDEIQPSDSHVQSLEEELRSTRSRLHTTVEELETANEELKSSNEEMMSMNEELQSTNEELATVNDELKTKVDELSVANADLMNFFASTALPLVVLDQGMRVRNFTEAILAIYPFRSSDRGRPLSDVTPALEHGDAILAVVTEVIDTGEARTLQVSDRDGARTWKLLVTPYRTREGRVEGATLVFTDITDALRLHSALEAESQRLRLALEVTRLGVWEFDPRSGRFLIDETSATHLGRGTSGEVSAQRLVNRFPAGEQPKARQAIEKAGARGEIDVNLRLELDDGASRILHLVGRRVMDRPDAALLGVMFDVTSEVEAARLRDLMLREMDHRVKNNLAIIMGILRGVGRTSGSVSEVVQGVQSRVDALARSHDMTQGNPTDRRISLRDAIGAALRPYEGHARMTIDGPEVSVTSKELTPLSLLLHEWATNAGKYGVLGPLEGELAIGWSVEDDGKVLLDWSEHYATPQTTEQGTPGFGSTLAKMSAIQLEGTVETEVTDAQRVSRLSFTPQAPQAG
ncbi:chemotaxis protein CheB [Halovulum sp. GXIMD14794]